MSLLLQEHFRCPDDVARFAVPAACDSQPGYFRFGPDTVVFGRLAGQKTASTPESADVDAADLVVFERGKCRLPFDPGEILDNLRFERYPGAGWSAGSGSWLRRLSADAYYAIRPCLPVSVRKHVQRLVARRHGQNTTFPAWPVDTTAERVLDRLLLLSMRAQGVERLPFIWFWPDGYNSAVIMTHDVETAAGRDFIPELMDLDGGIGMKASFQVIPERRYAVRESWLRSIRRRGFEVNIHDLNHDGHLFRNHELFLQRAAKINDYAAKIGANGFRSAVLYRNLDWFAALNFAYDMSLPNGAHYQPQAGGCCTVHPYFIGQLLELPGTAAQDYILFHILDDYSTAVWQRQLQAIAAAHGLICFSIHPDYILEKRARGIYLALLEILKKERASGRWWFALPGEVNAWWRQRRDLRLVRDTADTLHIEGPGAERASVAWAEIVDGQLNCRLLPNKKTVRI